MKNTKLLLIALMFVTTISKAQNLIPIPPILTGTNIDLMVQNGTTQFYPGFNTATNGYNGSYLGPTIVLQKGQTVNFNVMNMLNESTSTHWHGLHVAPMNDGSPHNPIAIGNTWSPSFTIMDNAATYWYHPHLDGSTMKQAIKGAAGLIIVQDPIESALALPRTYGVDDIPLVFQFETFNTTTKEIVINDELDNAVLVNGIVSNAMVNLPAQMVRLRLLNASSHRFFYFGFNDNRSFSQITSDDGLLNTPVPMTRLLLSPGERAEIVVDFSGQQGSTFYLKQNGTQLPAGYPGGPQDGMGMMVLGPLDNTNFNLLKINVIAPTANPVTTIPTTLTTNTVLSEVGSTSRTIAITGSPMMSMTNFLMNGVQFNPSVINFTTQQDKVEVWNITNNSMMPHPFHIHGNHFYVLKVNGVTPALNMQGRKDVITVPPNGGSVKLITQYKDFNDATMPYMYHCHILSHEDNGMMGQFIVNANLGIDELIKNESINVYPNPIKRGQSLHIISENNLISLHLFDVLGREIMLKKIDDNKATIDVENLNGIYIAQIKGEGGTITKKIIIN